MRSSTCLVWDCNTSEGCLEDQGVGYLDSLHGSVRHVHSILTIRVTCGVVCVVACVGYCVVFLVLFVECWDWIVGGLVVRRCYVMCCIVAVISLVIGWVLPSYSCVGHWCSS